jgi:hypothetical protein
LKQEQSNWSAHGRNHLKIGMEQALIALEYGRLVIDEKDFV